MIIVFLGSVGIANIPLAGCSHGMIPSSMGGDSGIWPLGFRISQERGDVMAADMARFFNPCKGAQGRVNAHRVDGLATSRAGSRHAGSNPYHGDSGSFLPEGKFSPMLFFAK